jgi:hypothetical protein
VDLGIVPAAARAGGSLLDIVLVAISRCLLVLLFLPFSALDKVLNFSDAEAQAARSLRNRTLSRLAILWASALK